MAEAYRARRHHQASWREIIGRHRQIPVYLNVRKEIARRSPEIARNDGLRRHLLQESWRRRLRAKLLPACAGVLPALFIFRP